MTVESRDFRGYLTETGRVVRKVQRSVDPGLARAGARWSNDKAAEPIIGEVRYREEHVQVRLANGRNSTTIRKWIVNLDCGWTITSTVSRRYAIEAALDHLQDGYKEHHKDVAT